MRVTAMLSIWSPDEAETRYLLGQMIPSLQGLADKLHVLDGAYEGFPGATPASPSLAEIIRPLCDRVYLDVEIEQPDVLWPGHVAKRQALTTAAMEDADWVFNADTDYVFVGDMPGVRSELEQSAEFDLFTAPFYTPPPPLGNAEKIATSEHHLRTAGTTTMQPCFIRALPGFRYEFRHWCKSALKNGKRVSLWGAESWYPTVMQSALASKFEVVHRKFFRKPERVDALRAYYAQRAQIVEETGVEP